MVDLSLEVGANCAAIGVSADHVEVLDQIRDLRASGEGLRVGASIPLRPPFGASAIAWAPPDAVERWLGHAPAANRAHYREALDAIRARGYTLEAAASSTNRLEDLLAFAGDDLTDAQRDRAMFEPDLLDRIARELATQDDYLVATIEPTRDYTIVTLSAPVFDADGGVPLLLSVWGFPSRVDGGQVDRIGRRLSEAATALSRSVSVRQR
jgi:DNA-binding IclR family transcriptional regulator